MAERNVSTVPAELQWLVEQINSQTCPARRAALIGAIHNAAASCLLMHQSQPAQPADDLPPLTREQRAVLDYLRENGVTPAEELASHAGYATKTIRRWCTADGDLAAHGVYSTSKGYAVKQ